MAGGQRWPVALALCLLIAAAGLRRPRLRAYTATGLPATSVAGAAGLRSLPQLPAHHLQAPLNGHVPSIPLSVEAGAVKGRLALVLAGSACAAIATAVLLGRRGPTPGLRRSTALRLVEPGSPLVALAPSSPGWRRPMAVAAEPSPLLRDTEDLQLAVLMELELLRERQAAITEYLQAPHEDAELDVGLVKLRVKQEIEEWRQREKAIEDVFDLQHKAHPSKGVEGARVRAAVELEAMRRTEDALEAFLARPAEVEEVRGRVLADLWSLRQRQRTIEEAVKELPKSKSSDVAKARILAELEELHSHEAALEAFLSPEARAGKKAKKGGEDAMRVRVLESLLALRQREDALEASASAPLEDVPAEALPELQAGLASEVEALKWQEAALEDYVRAHLKE